MPVYNACVKCLCKILHCQSPIRFANGGLYNALHSGVTSLPNPSTERQGVSTLLFNPFWFRVLNTTLIKHFTRCFVQKQSVSVQDWERGRFCFPQSSPLTFFFSLLLVRNYNSATFERQNVLTETQFKTLATVLQS